MRDRWSCRYRRRMETPETGGLETFLVEAYATARVRDMTVTIGRARRTAEDMRRAGDEIEYITALYMPDDEVIFHVVAARDAVSVERLCTRSPLAWERIVPSVVIGGWPDHLHGQGDRRRPMLRVRASASRR
jgi:hypothetical protein